MGILFDFCTSEHSGEAEAGEKREVVSVSIVPQQEEQALAQLLYKHDGIL